MSIEESIEILKNMILMPDGWIIGKDYKGNCEFIGCLEGQEAIETLLTVYEKEKGENVKLRLQDIPLIEGELKAYKDRVNELKQELEKEKEKNKALEDTLKQTQNSWYEDTKIIDKIKAKIEEIDMTGEIGYLVKVILQSLLEKE